MIVQKTGDTMTGNLTAPVITATDHMEGVYASQKFELSAIGHQYIDLDIPIWCRKIEVNFIDQYSTGPAIGTQVAYWRFLDNTGVSYTTTAAGTRNAVQWGSAFAGSSNLQDLNNALVYGPPAKGTYSGSHVINLAEGLAPGETSFRCVYTGSGSYVSANLGPWIQSGVMLGSPGAPFPAQFRFATYRDTSGQPVAKGQVKFYS